VLTTAPGITERFLSKVSHQGECWEWIAFRDRDGYGKFFTHKVNGCAVKEYAHRWAYSRWRGDIPEGMQIDHLCRNRACVRPEHLEAVTAKVNNSRSNSLSAQRARKTHCVRGHPLEGANVHITTKGQRRCRTCDRDAHNAKRTPQPHYNSRKTHCKHGHEFAGANLIIVAPNRRVCRACQIAAHVRCADLLNLP